MRPHVSTAALKAFWGSKSRNRAGLPKPDRDLRDLIQRMSPGDPTFILGFVVTLSTREPRLQTWKTFLRDAWAVPSGRVPL